ncbi:MAG: DUF1697 domain-containing protein [Anaerolineales bacterium]|nr:DUF1697 domain-containing protein [Anaerolineales bacterium]
MPQYITFLRAINVGGRFTTMEILRGAFEALGFTNVETFINSGNVIFETKTKSEGALVKQIEAQLQATLGYEVATFLRTPHELTGIANYQPFSAARLKTAGALNVAFLAQPLSAEAQKQLLTLKTEIDDFHPHGREVYWLCAVKQSDSKFSNAVFERKLKLQATFRSITTVQKLAAKYGDTKG